LKRRVTRGEDESDAEASFPDGEADKPDAE
jgi:hypothetical protein